MNGLDSKKRLMTEKTRIPTSTLKDSEISICMTDGSETTTVKFSTKKDL